MAKLDKISGNDYDEFSTNELYLRQAAILDEKDESRIRFENEKEHNAVKQVMEGLDLEISKDSEGEYITLADLVKINEVLEKEKFGNQDIYNNDDVDIVIDEIIEDVVQKTKSERNTKYGQDSLTKGQKERAKTFLGEGAENVKNMYINTAEMLVDAGYWGSDIMNERLQDIMNGDRLIGESYGVMMDALVDYGITDTNHNIIGDWYNEEDGITAYESEKVTLSEDNQGWANTPDYVANSLTDDILEDIRKLLYGDGDKNTKEDNTVKDSAEITVIALNGEEIDTTIGELLSDENLESLPPSILEQLKSSLEGATNAAGKITISDLDSETMNTVYQYKTLKTELENIVANDSYYQSYLEALENGEMTPQEIVAAINDEDSNLLSDFAAQEEGEKSSETLIKDIKEILYGDENDATDDAIQSTDKITVHSLNGEEVETTMGELLSDENLESLPPSILEDIKSTLESSKDAAGKITISDLDSETMNTVYQYKTLKTELENIISNDSYYQSYLEALENGEMTPQEIVAAVNSRDGSLLNDFVEGEENTGELSDEQINEIAKSLHDAMKGLGTDESTVKSILNSPNLSDADLIRVMQSYPGGSLVRDIQRDFSGEAEDSLISQITDKLTAQAPITEETADLIAKELYVATAAYNGTNEQFVEEIFEKLSNEDLSMVNNRYSVVNEGRTLKNDIKEDFSGKAEDALLERLNLIELGLA